MSHSVNPDGVIVQRTAPVDHAMTSPRAAFDQRCQSHLKHLKLKGLQPKTVDTDARAIRRIGQYFGHRIDNLSGELLTDYFSELPGYHAMWGRLSSERESHHS